METFHMSLDHKSQKNDPLKKLYWKSTLGHSYWKPTGRCSDQRESMLLMACISIYTKFLWCNSAEIQETTQ